MNWSGDPPAAPGEFAKFFEAQIEAAQTSEGDQPATPPEVAREYEKHLERAREEAFRDARAYFLRRAHNAGLGTQTELGNVFEVSQSSVCRTVQDPAGDDPRTTPVFGNADD